MDFAFDDGTLGLIDEVNALMDEFVYPAEVMLHSHATNSKNTEGSLHDR